MSDPFVAEVRLFSFDVMPRGWVHCDGRELAIESYQPLFSLLGWRWGGDRQATFGVPALGQQETQILFGIAIDGVYAPRDGNLQMKTTYVGEIRLFGGNFVPAGWAVCDGRELPIDDSHATLYSLIGRRFGGGENTFAVPDLRDRVADGVNFIIALNGEDPRAEEERL